MFVGHNLEGETRMSDWTIGMRMVVERQKEATTGRPLLKIHRSIFFNSPPRTLHQFGYRIVLLECERFLSLLLNLPNALIAIGDGSIELRSLQTFNSERMSLFSACLVFDFLVNVENWARAF